MMIFIVSVRSTSKIFYVGHCQPVSLSACQPYTCNIRIIATPATIVSLFLRAYLRFLLCRCSLPLAPTLPPAACSSSTTSFWFSFVAVPVDVAVDAAVDVVAATAAVASVILAAVSAGVWLSEWVVALDSSS
jgi:hypothetical protein